MEGGSPNPQPVMLHSAPLHANLDLPRRIGVQFATMHDQAARRMMQNRSALIRDALRDHLKKLETRASEERDRMGYAKRPQAVDEAVLWETEAAGPAE